MVCLGGGPFPGPQRGFERARWKKLSTSVVRMTCARARQCLKKACLQSLLSTFSPLHHINLITVMFAWELKNNYLYPAVPTFCRMFLLLFRHGCSSYSTFSSSSSSSFSHISSAFSSWCFFLLYFLLLFLLLLLFAYFVRFFVMIILPPLFSPLSLFPLPPPFCILRQPFRHDYSSSSAFSSSFSPWYNRTG